MTAWGLIISVRQFCSLGDSALPANSHAPRGHTHVHDTVLSRRGLKKTCDVVACGHTADQAPRTAHRRRGSSLHMTQGSAPLLHWHLEGPQRHGKNQASA